MCQLQNNFSKNPTPQFFFLGFKQLSELFFYKFQIAGSKFQKPDSNIHNLLILKVATLKTFSFLNFFSALYKFWNVLIVYLLVMSHTSVYLFF